MSTKPRYACHAEQCDWTPDTTDPEQAALQLAEHAEDSGHPLCRMCQLSLNPVEPRTCEKCLTRTRTNLRELLGLYALLPAELGRLGSPTYDRGSPSAADGAPLPGGTALTLLAGGNNGGESRPLPSNHPTHPVRWWLELATGPLTRTAYRTLQRAAEGREHAADQHQDDPPSIAWTLTSWEADWRDLIGDPPAPQPRTASQAADWLDTHTRWAANAHDDFPDYARELRDLLTHVKQATGRNDRNLRAPAACFDCGSNKLERTYTNPKPCRHRRPPQQRLTLPANPKRDYGPRCETPLGRRTRLDKWEREHATCQQGGLTEHWQCPACGRTYQPDSYWLALRDRLEKTS